MYGFLDLERTLEINHFWPFSLCHFINQLRRVTWYLTIRRQGRFEVNRGPLGRTTLTNAVQTHCLLGMPGGDFHGWVCVTDSGQWGQVRVLQGRPTERLLINTAPSTGAQRPGVMSHVDSHSEFLLCIKSTDWVLSLVLLLKTLIDG